MRRFFFGATFRKMKWPSIWQILGVVLVSAGAGGSLKATEGADPSSLLNQLTRPAGLRSQAREALAREGSQILPLLVERIEDPSFVLRWEIVNLLGRLGDPEALGPLIGRVLHDGNPHVRWRSMWALKRIRAASTSDELARYLGGSGTDAWNAAVALSLLEDMRALPFLYRGLDSTDPWVRWEAVNALGRLHDGTSSERLARLLDDPETRIRREVVLSLGQIGDPRVARELIRALEDPSSEVRWRAAMELERIPSNKSRRALEKRLEVESDALTREHLERAIRKSSTAGPAPSR